VRLGVISDTHGLLRPEVFDVFAEVDHILHGGDVGRPAILEKLGTIAPVTAVYGNTDGGDIRDRLPQVATIELDGFTIVVTHGDQFGSPTPERLQAAFPRAEIIVYGHTHRPLLTLVDVVVTVMNPGGAGPRRFDLPPSVGILELEPGIPPRGTRVRVRSDERGVGKAWGRG
jgi:putative phosphoesterase